VPVQSVFRHGDGVVAFVTQGDDVEMRPVRIGRQTEVWVQVLDGLAEGETVMLSPPPGFVADAGKPAAKGADGESRANDRDGRPGRDGGDRGARDGQ
jgi:multidrug efflux pump subunit AcrA (membrane-fusion protein)